MKKILVLVLLITFFASSNTGLQAAKFTGPTVSTFMFNDDLCFDNGDGNCVYPGDPTPPPPSFQTQKGDIYVRTYSIPGHAGIAIDSYTLVEAELADGVNQSPVSDWKTRYNHFVVLRVYSASVTERSSAANYAIAQLGDYYSIFSNRMDTYRWYCSQLVWRSYLEQGYDIESYGWQQGVGLITPGDLIESPLTTQVYSYNN